MILRIKIKNNTSTLFSSQAPTSCVRTSLTNVYSKFCCMKNDVVRRKCNFQPNNRLNGDEKRLKPFWNNQQQSAFYWKFNIADFFWFSPYLICYINIRCQFNRLEKMKINVSDATMCAYAFHFHDEKQKKVHAITDSHNLT